MKTINQINSFIEQDQTINFYVSLCTDYQQYRHNWRNQHFTFLRQDRSPAHLSPAGNWIYGQAVRQLCRYRGTDDFYNYERDNRSALMEIDFSHYSLEFKLKLEIGLQGIQLIVYTNFKEFKHYERFAVRSNESFESLDIANYFLKKILPKRLYPEGIFRNIQVMRNCSKAKAREFYKEHVSLTRERKPEYIDTEKAWKQLFLRRFNIEICDSINEKSLPRIAGSMKRQGTRKKLFKYPSMFELCDRYSSEHDEDGHEEEFLSEVENEYPKNVMFI